MSARIAGLALASALVACSQGGDNQATAHYAGIGRAATAAELKAWDIDFNPSGAGLPLGSGTYANGVAVYAKQCAGCHGPKGEGMPGNPKLVGRDPRDFTFATDMKATKTVGNYWPYATTLYDYINRAMPFATPGSLTPDDVYGVVAFILVENGIVDSTMVIDAQSLPQVKMPARDRFVLDNRSGGPTFR